MFIISLFVFFNEWFWLGEDSKYLFSSKIVIYSKQSEMWKKVFLSIKEN